MAPRGQVPVQDTYGLEFDSQHKGKFKNSNSLYWGRIAEFRVDLGNIQASFSYRVRSCVCVCVKFKVWPKKCFKSLMTFKE